MTKKANNWPDYRSSINYSAYRVHGDSWFWVNTVNTYERAREIAGPDGRVERHTIIREVMS